MFCCDSLIMGNGVCSSRGLSLLPSVVFSPAYKRKMLYDKPLLDAVAISITDLYLHNITYSVTRLGCHTGSLGRITLNLIVLCIYMYNVHVYVEA